MRNNVVIVTDEKGGIIAVDVEHRDLLCVFIKRIKHESSDIVTCYQR